jgi:hypothetical protein
VKPHFPIPVIFRRQRHWRLSELLIYEAAAAGLPQPAPLNPEDEVYLTAAQIRKRYGDVSDMWIYRRLAERNSAEAA